MDRGRNDARQAVGEFIRMQRGLAHLSLRQLAELARVSNAYLSQVERGVYMPSAYVLKNIAAALELSAETLYERAGLLDDESPAESRQPVEDAIRLDDTLTAEQKDALIRVYRGFRS
jgi:transcriptional regulator with XRE-family HTH domain